MLPVSPASEFWARVILKKQIVLNLQILEHPRDENHTRPGEHFIPRHPSVILPVAPLSTALKASHKLTFHGHAPNRPLSGVSAGGRLAWASGRLP